MKSNRKRPFFLEIVLGPRSLSHYQSGPPGKKFGHPCPNALSPALKKISSYLSYLEKLVIKLSSAESDDKDELENALKEQHVKKSVFDSKITEFLECSDVTSTEIKSLLSAPRTLRSQVSMSVTTTSSYKVALAKADEQVALLKLTHLERQLDIEREEAKIKFKRDMEEYELKRKRDVEEYEL